MQTQPKNRGTARLRGEMSGDERPEGSTFPIRPASPVSSCLVCEQTQLARIHRTRYQHLLRCQACGLVFGWPVFSRESLLDYSETSFRGEGFPETADFFDRRRIARNGSGSLRQYRSGLEQISRIVPSGTLLDVGCGVPIFLDLARSAGYAVLGIDAVPEVAAIARSEFALEVQTAAFDRCEFRNQSAFDAITMWDFLEHVPDPMATLAHARELLRPNGVLFVSAPNYRSVLHGVAGFLARLGHSAIDEAMDKLYHFSHVCVWSPRAIEAALTRTGFSPLARGFSSPDLNRYHLRRSVRAGLTAVDWAGQLTGLRSRLWVLARASG